MNITHFNNFIFFTDFLGSSDLPVIGLSLNLTDPKDVVVSSGQSATFKCEAVSTNGDTRVSIVDKNISE